VTDPEPTRPVLPDETHLGRAALAVPDLGAATDFYSTVVGLAVLERSQERAVLGVEDRPLVVLEATTDERTADAAGLYHIAVRVPSRGALGDALARVREDWHLDGASDHRVSEALYLTDPAGNGVEIYRDYPRDAWPRAADGTVEMATDPLDLEALDAAATGADGADRAPSGTDLGHVHLEVTSLPAFRECYVETFGFEVQAEVRGAAFVGAGGYHHHVGANVWNHRREPAGGRGLAWFEVVLPGADALDALRDRLWSRETDVGETDDGFAVADPDGVEIRFRAGPPRVE